MSFLPYIEHLGIFLSIYVILALSFQIAIGFTGMINLGHIAFFGIGAYASALLTTEFGFPIWLGFIFAFLVSGAIGALIALPTNKIKGDYLALVTLGFGFIMDAVARNWIALTDGALGIKGIPRIFTFKSLYLAFGVLMAALVYIVLKYVTKSRIGRMMQAIRDDELAASTLGKNTHLYKIFALGISASVAGIAGALYAHYITFIDPTIFNMNDMILMLAMVIIGGLASLEGAVLGAIVVFLLPEPLRFLGLPSTMIGPVRAMLFALILLLIMIYKPKGFLGKVDLG